MSRVVTVVCDLCGKEVEPNVRYVNAGVYGKECHIKCFFKLDSFEVLWFLGLDRVEFEILGSDEARERAMKKPDDMRKFQS